MTRDIPRTMIGGCPCGAATDTQAKRCVKCRNRARWHRRKALHDGL
ncbi:hypothetical protein [Nonomuraea sp. NPDC050310]